jgi:hypothetical protein
VITVRTAAFPAVNEGGSAAIETVNAAEDAGLSSFKGEEIAQNDRPELTSARIIISGGRSLGSADAFRAPGIGFGEHGDDYVRFALVKNEQRIRQAARNIRKFFDGADQTLHNVVPRSARAR